ncbi:MAG: TadE family protein [Bryobacter sp.]|nr:TadE family protein [Bryobacter sp.]
MPPMTIANPISSRRRRSQRGNALVEFAMIFPFLTTMLVGGFTMGMSLTRAVQASQLCRNANVLMVRSIDLSRPSNQQLLIRTGAGLGLNVPGTSTPNPNGKGVIILTKVIRVGNNACYLGIPAWNGNPSSCPNHGQYVIAQRITMGNSTRWTSVTGNPGSTLLSDGSVSEANIANVTSNRASGFPGIVSLSEDEFTFVSEVFADVSELTLLNFLRAPIISVRNVS